MTSILKTDEIQSQNGGAVVKMQTLKHPSASGNNLVLGSDGSATINQISSSTVFPAGIALQTLRDDYASQTEASSSVKVHELTLTTKKANSKLAYFFCSAIGGYGDADNVLVQMTLETGTTANSPSSSNFLPTTNRSSGTNGQAFGRQLYLDVQVQSAYLPSYQMLTYSFNDLITTSYAKDTQITMGVFIQGNCWINRPSERANNESGLTTLIVQEIAT